MKKLIAPVVMSLLFASCKKEAFVDENSIISTQERIEKLSQELIQDSNKTANNVDFLQMKPNTFFDKVLIDNESIKVVIGNLDEKSKTLMEHENGNFSIDDSSVKLPLTSIIDIIPGKDSSIFSTNGQSLDFYNSNNGSQILSGNKEEVLPDYRVINDYLFITNKEAPQLKKVFNSKANYLGQIENFPIHGKIQMIGDYIISPNLLSLDIHKVSEGSISKECSVTGKDLVRAAGLKSLIKNVFLTSSGYFVIGIEKKKKQYILIEKNDDQLIERLCEHKDLEYIEVKKKDHFLNLEDHKNNLTQVKGSIVLTNEKIDEKTQKVSILDLEKKRLIRKNYENIKTIGPYLQDSLSNGTFALYYSPVDSSIEDMNQLAIIDINFENASILTHLKSFDSKKSEIFHLGEYKIVINKENSKVHFLSEVDSFSRELNKKIGKKSHKVNENLLILETEKGIEAISIEKSLSLKHSAIVYEKLQNIKNKFIFPTYFKLYFFDKNINIDELGIIEKKFEQLQNLIELDRQIKEIKNGPLGKFI